jgi:hypothetical protein
LGPIQGDLDFISISRELVRLDVRAEERWAFTTSVPFGREIARKIKEGMEKLRPFEREAVRQLLIEGELTDQRAIGLLRATGILIENVMAVFYLIWTNTGFVQRVWQPSDQERVHGYTGPWVINPKFKDGIEAYFRTNS